MSPQALLGFGVIGGGLVSLLVLFGAALGHVADAYLPERPLELAERPCETRVLPSGRLVDIYEHAVIGASSKGKTSGFGPENRRSSRCAPVRKRGCVR